MSEWVRVRQPETGHYFTTKNPVEGLEVVDKPAVDVNGRPLPPKYYRNTTTTPPQADLDEEFEDDAADTTENQES